MYTQNWEKDWSVCKQDRDLSSKMSPIFDSYLESLVKNGVSITTFNCHQNACHELGSYIVAQIFTHNNNPFTGTETGKEILLNYINKYGGPLINQDNQNLQRQINITCKKLFKFLQQFK